MPFPWMAAATIGGSLASGLLGKSGQESANATNMALAREQREWQAEQNAKAMDFSADQADVNRQFQERMSSSAYQRSMQDMKKAGLNPMLAAMKGGASTPGGSSASGVTSSGAKAEVKSTMEQMANSALHMTTQLANIKKIQAETELTTNKSEIIEPLSEVMNELEGAINGMRDYFDGNQSGSLGANTAKTVLKNFESVYKSVRDTISEKLTPGIQVTDHVRTSQHSVPDDGEKQRYNKTMYITRKGNTSEIRRYKDDSLVNTGTWNPKTSKMEWKR